MPAAVLQQRRRRQRSIFSTPHRCLLFAGFDTKWRKAALADFVAASTFALWGLSLQTTSSLEQCSDSGKSEKEIVMPTAHRPYHRIVVGIDGSGSSAATLDWAAQQAALTQSALDVLITWEWPILGRRSICLSSRL